MASPGPPERHRFGPFELQPDNRRLLNDGAAISLRPRAFDLLAALVDRAGHLVTKDELLDRVWPKMVVEEAALHVQVSALRRVLGVDAITTVSGRGYQFTLPVTKVDGEANPASRSKHNLPCQLTSLVGRAGSGVLLLLLLLVAAPTFAGSVNLAWDPVTSPPVAGYKVYYGPADGNYPSHIDVGNATTYTASGLVEGSTYHFAVTAYNASLTESGFSNDVSAPVNAVAIEYYHAGIDHYFITTNADEITKLDNGTFVGWSRTGATFEVYPLAHAGSANVCRFFSTSFALKSSHFYTPSASECSTVKANRNWQFEAEVFSVDAPTAAGACASGTQPLYRLYNNGQGAAPNHRYTTSTTTRSTMIGKGWIPEGNGALGVIGCVPT